MESAGFAKLHVTTPHTLVPSHNNSSRRSNLRSTLYMRSLPWYGLISLKYLSLQFLAKCPYLSYNQHSVSVFSSQYNCSTPPFTPLTDCSICRTVELTMNRHIYKYVPWYDAQCRSQCIQQSMNQFSNTERSVTTVAHDELRWSSLMLHLTKATCCLSSAAAVCVHSV